MKYNQSTESAETRCRTIQKVTKIMLYTYTIYLFCFPCCCLEYENQKQQGIGSKYKFENPATELPLHIKIVPLPSGWFAKQIIKAEAR